MNSVILKESSHKNRPPSKPYVVYRINLSASSRCVIQSLSEQRWL